MQVTVTIRTSAMQYPGGTVGGDWRLEAALASDPGTIANEYEGPSPSTTWDLTENETYNFKAVRLDAGGAVLGPVATAQFVVGSDLVEIDVAQSISASSSPVSRAASGGHGGQGGGQPRR